MNDVGLDRVREDLEAMKQAAGTELPFGREDLKWGWIDWAGICAAGRMVMAWTRHIHVGGNHPLAAGNVAGGVGDRAEASTATRSTSQPMARNTIPNTG